MKPNRRLLEVADALAKGDSIDWGTLSVDFPDLAPQLESLRVLHALAQETMRDDSADADPPLTPPFAWGPLQVLEKLGSGGFGDVYRAHDPVLDREVALKLRRSHQGAKAESYEAHLAEARRLARIRHPNVVAVHGIEVHDDRVGMWTDLLRGQTLEERLREEGPFPATELARIGVDLCRALAAVHDAGLIHADVKPANVMLERDGRTILMDFGAGSTRDSLSGARAGTPLAMAPELLRQGAPSVASDLYALGALLYRTSTGNHPLPATTWEELLAAHAAPEIVPLSEVRPDLPVEFSRVVHRALEAEAENRPATASEMEIEISGALASEDEGPLGGVSGTHDGGPNSAAPRPAALPRVGTRFIGRRSELLAVRRLLVAPGLVTLVGAGGCGKTRLAHRVATDLASGLPDGVLWIELAGLRDETGVPRALASQLGIREERDRTIEELVISALAEFNALLVLDNCEHLAAQVAEFVQRLLVSSPRLRVLATSRRPLAIEGERAYRVPSLSLPPSDGTGSEVAGSEAVRLFLDRVCRRSPDFVLNASNASPIARIARRVDGIPLAIELAAARVFAMSVEELADRLDANWRLLVARDTATVARQQTLRASIEWSYQLLSPPEALLLDRLSAFAAGFTLSSAEAIAADRGASSDTQPRQAASATVTGIEVIELLERLVDASLVQFEDGGRYRILEMVRSFAAERLEARGETIQMQNRLAPHWENFLRTHRPGLSGPDAVAVCALHDAERDNIRASLSWTAAAPSEQLEDPEVGPNLAMWSMHYFEIRGQFTEALSNVERHEVRLAPEAPLRATLLTCIASLQYRHGRLQAARDTFGRAVVLHRSHQSIGELAVTLSALGNLTSELGDHDAALGHLAESLECFRAIGHDIGANGALCTLGVLETRVGNLDRAEANFQAALEGSRSANFLGPIPMILRNLSRIALRRGDLERARALGDESLALLRRSGDQATLLGTLHNLAEVAIAQRASDEARSLLLEALELCRAQAQLGLLPAVLDALAELALQNANPARTARILGALDALRAAHDLVLPPYEQARSTALLDQARAQLGEDHLIAALASGRALSREELFTLASEAQ
ncbi:MAG: protein kinase [Candidatus Eisenbacteria bacterium]|nr:protein kinase [Candidatus Eisenbacteria bacterium]